MQELELTWASFHSHLPDEMLYPEEPDENCAIRFLVTWPAGIFASWHYWAYLQTDNPLHGLHASAILRDHPTCVPKELLADSIYKVWRDAKKMTARKNSFIKASNEFLMLLATQQLNLLCNTPLEDCYIRTMAKADRLGRPFNKATTFKQSFYDHKAHNPVFQMTDRVLRNLADQRRLEITDETIDQYLEEFPTTNKIGIVGSLYD